MTFKVKKEDWDTTKIGQAPHVHYTLVGAVEAAKVLSRFDRTESKWLVLGRGDQVITSFLKGEEIND